MANRYLGSLYLALAASIWGGMYVVSKFVLTDVAPIALVWLRYVVALVALLTSALVTKQTWRLGRRDMGLVAAVGVIGYVISIWMQFLGTKLATAQLGAVITSATPAFMVLFARLLLGERITQRKIMSVVMATAGVVVVIGFHGAGQNYQLGGFVLLVAALTWGLMSVLVKKVSENVSSITLTTYSILVATLLLTPSGLVELTHSNLAVLGHPSVWGGILYLGLISTAAAFFLWNRGLQLTQASSGGIYFFFQPLVGATLGWLVLGEQVGVSFWIGSMLIVIGVILTLRDAR
ncbi:MAG: hypothetical protein A2201_06280 [Alicyclobacillus sp. RIFOXYA1_FULL_53_8]|nr:MAG: hypothetical protein A2201_06280 [Alicyclobacillus sp. RIFOXYA1_FULL_53_8]